MHRKTGAISRSILVPLSAVILSCGGGQSDSGGGGFGDGDGDGDGGNVGFGGAQDIGQFRALLDAGEIPGPSTLDANGFFSEHRTELPPPDCGQTLCAHGMLSIGHDWIDERYQATLQVSMNTPVDPATLERLPLNLAVVVDTSGSMSADDRIGFVKQGLHLLVDELAPGDRLALITYATTATQHTGLDADPVAEELHPLIDSLEAVGATNIYDALELGMSEVAENYDVERQNRVILLSDGQPTAGVLDTGAIIDMAETYIEDGIGLTTIGVGLDFNVDLMRGLAEGGAGNFYFLEDSSATTEVFTEELDYFVTPLALGVRLQVTAGAGYGLGDVYGTKLWKTPGDYGEVFLPAVFVASRTDDENPEGRRGGGSALFIELDPDDTAFEPGPAAVIDLSYKLPGSDELITQQVVIESPYPPGESPAEAFVSREAMREHYAIFNAYLGLLGAATRASDNDYHCAAGILADTRQHAIAHNERYPDPDIAADIELIDQFRDLLLEEGASPAATSETCAAIGDDGDINDGWGDDDEPGWTDGWEGAQHCSAAGRGAGAGWLITLFAAALAFRRRRRSPV
jgi:Ca-activated chloride channel family protein